jgi:hypothetical protein
LKVACKVQIDADLLCIFIENVGSMGKFKVNKTGGIKLRHQQEVGHKK